MNIKVGDKVRWYDWEEDETKEFEVIKVYEDFALCSNEYSDAEIPFDELELVWGKYKLNLVILLNLKKEKMRNKDCRHSDEMDMRLKELEKSDRKYMDNVKGYKKPKHKTNYRKAM